MTRTEQKTFVKDLTKTVTKSILASITSKNIPADWDGHELRALLADKFTWQACGSIITKEPRSSRARSYHNTYLIANL